MKTDYFFELDKIENLPVTAKCLSRVNYKDHVECHNYYESGKTSKELAIKERSYYFSFKIHQGECTIFQTEHMNAEQEWIIKTGKTTETAVRRAIKEFYKRYNK